MSESLVDFTAAPACDGFAGACGAPAGAACEPGCPSLASDDLPLVALPDPAVVARNAWASGVAVAPGLPSYDSALAFADAVLSAPVPSGAVSVDIRLADGSPVLPESLRVFAVWVWVA